MSNISWADLKLVIGGVEMPAPISYDVELNDYDGDSVRDVKHGELSRIVIRKDVKKITLKYSIMDIDTLSLVLNTLHPDKLTVQCFDEMTIARVTKYMYCNKKSFGLTCIGPNSWVKTMDFPLVEY